ncbi:MAG: Ldh family oxidoreductase [Sporolactobacillus sp.]|jgi:LDH2 family malate/lactate/ureidoglycolate dehydrogenase|nr:Ldh family oxidoreductase [Sporolactobacillus sp.]
MGIYSAGNLKKFIQTALVFKEVAEKDARIVADVLVKADLEGISSHGIGRFPAYFEQLVKGKINPLPSITIHKKGPSVLVVDGDGGFGSIISYKAMAKGITLARKTGISAVAVHNSHHFGCASYYAEMAAKAGLIAIVTTDSPPGIAPWGGRQAFLGTNPIAFSFPVSNGPDVVVDMSSSVVARGKIVEAAKCGEKIPADWAIDPEGFATENPADALSGSLLPLGGAKGYCLALAIEILTKVLTNTASGSDDLLTITATQDMQTHIGHFFILIDIRRFINFDTFTTNLQTMLHEMKHVQKREGIEEILYPGERRWRSYFEKLKRGVHLSPEVENELNRLAHRYRLEPLTEGI